jgi:hypothetical protein
LKESPQTKNSCSPHKIINLIDYHETRKADPVFIGADFFASTTLFVDIKNIIRYRLNPVQVRAVGFRNHEVELFTAL